VFENDSNVSANFTDASYSLNKRQVCTCYCHDNPTLQWTTGPPPT